MVVLPSPGAALVTRTTLWARSTSTNCRLVRSWRNASAPGACGSSRMISGCAAASGLRLTAPRTGAPTTCRSWRSEVSEVSSRLRTSAAPRPRSSPSTAPRMKLKRRPRRDGVGRWGGGLVDLGGDQRAGQRVRWLLELRHVLDEPLRDEVGDRGGALGGRVRGRRRQQDGLGHRRGGDVARELGGGHPQLRCHLAGDLLAGEQLDVGRHPLHGELVRRHGRRVGDRGLRRDEDRDACGVLTRREPRDRCRDDQPEDQAADDERPALAEDVEVLTRSHEYSPLAMASRTLHRLRRSRLLVSRGLRPDDRSDPAVSPAVG